MTTWAPTLLLNKITHTRKHFFVHLNALVYSHCANESSESPLRHGIKALPPPPPPLEDLDGADLAGFMVCSFSNDL